MQGAVSEPCIFYRCIILIIVGNLVIDDISTVIVDIIVDIAII